MTEPALEFADSFGRLIFEIAWKSTIILGSVVLLGKLLKQRSASFRRMVYSKGILTMLCFIVITPVSPRWTINTPDWLSVFSSQKTTLNKWAAEPESRVFRSGVGNFGPGNDLGNKQSGGSFVSLMMMLFPFVWLAITLFLLGRLIAKLTRLKHLRQTSSLQTGDNINFLMQETAGNFGYEKQFVTILRNDAVEVPVAWGLFRHFIIIPKDFEKLPAENCRLILIHELAHIKRYDFVTRIFAEILCAVLWFQPLAWAARKNLKETQERAADDCVLKMGEKASSYAKLLLEWNDRLSGKGFSIVPGAVEQKGLKSRLEAILNPRLRRRPVTIVEISVICLIIFSLAIPLTGMGLSMAVKPLAEQNLFEVSNLPNSSQQEAKSPGSSNPTGQAIVSKANAIEIATNFQPGTVIESEFGQSDEGLVYKILIRNKGETRGNVTRLTINALDGRIMKTWRGIRK